jgi:conjugal transfer pilus assembly protein TraA
MKNLQTLFRELLHGPTEESPGASSVAVPAEPSAWAELRRGASVLEGRGGRLQKYGTLFASFAAFLGILILLASGYAVLIDGPSSIGSIHVPASIQNQYSNSVDKAAAAASVAVEAGRAYSHSSVSSLSNVTDNIFDLLDGTLMRLVAGAMVMIGIMSGVIRQSVMSMVAGVGGGVMLFNMPTVIKSILGEHDQQPSAQQVEVLTAPKRLDSMEFTQLHTALAIIDSISPSERAYILSQAAIIEDLKAQQIIAEAAAYIRAGNLNFSVPASYAYAIEKAADGEFKTKGAVNLDREYRERVQAAKDTARALSWPLTLLMALSGLFMIFAAFMRRRVSRVRQMIGQLTGSGSGDGLAS